MPGSLSGPRVLLLLLLLCCQISIKMTCPRFPDALGWFHQNHGIANALSYQGRYLGPHYKKYGVCHDVFNSLVFLLNHDFNFLNFYYWSKMWVTVHDVSNTNCSAESNQAYSSPKIVAQNTLGPLYHFRHTAWKETINEINYVHL
jgi:hypothetical protein